jgi:hypothetical protein
MNAEILEVVDHWTVICRLDLPLAVSIVRPVRLTGVTVLKKTETIEFLRELIGCSVSVFIREDKTKKYGQLLGRIVHKGSDISSLLIDSKYAKKFK